MKLNYYLSLAALIPAAILFVRIYQLDHIEKEPRRLLGKLVLFGALAAVPAALAQLLLTRAAGAALGRSTVWYLLLDNFVIVACSEELAKLQMECDPLPFDEILAAIHDIYGDAQDEIFDAIDPKPLGSASLAQVHKARLVNGDIVAVKIQRPGVKATMAQDIDIMRIMARQASRFMKDNQMLDLQEVVEELWTTFLDETDFGVEAANLQEFAELNKDVAFIGCPKVYPELCGEYVLVMEYIEGIPISNRDKLVECGYDLEEIGRKVLDNYATQILDHGFFHADPHPGNMLIRDGQVIYIDLGIMGRLSARDRAGFGNIISAVGKQDAAGDEGAAGGAQGAHRGERGGRLGAHEGVEDDGVVGAAAPFEEGAAVVAENAQVAAAGPGERDGLVEEEPAARGADDGRVDLDDVGAHAGMLGGDELGEREASPADREDAARGGPQLEEAREGAVVGKDRLHAARPEVGRRLVDASCAQHPHGLARAAAHGVDERNAPGDAHDVRVQRPHAAREHPSRGRARQRERHEPTVLLARHATPFL